jgi:hypothetical protein
MKLPVATATAGGELVCLRQPIRQVREMSSIPFKLTGPLLELSLDLDQSVTNYDFEAARRHDQY